jgi:hypothetical protein
VKDKSGAREKEGSPVGKRRGKKWERKGRETGKGRAGKSIEGRREQ